jgi:hypothetical protein
MNTMTGAEFPSLADLSAEQKQRLLALLIKDELDRQPIPMLIPVRLDGQDLGDFSPRIHHPVKTTLPPVQVETLTLDELRALEAMGSDKSST